ncbi:Uncharacterized protein dnm_071020 [Desulfonema magnum]|uniref:Uncharacterized protein n=1 Tax=Desulfonema magnum TaxID=45655 RepID=A0A975BSW2_9BACT|nr:Uncharacterized protein dnm_071020 [Desulfonema magnum]
MPFQTIYFSFFTVKIHFEKPGFLSENIFITGGKKPGFFMSVYFHIALFHPKKNGYRPVLRQKSDHNSFDI